MADQNYDAIIIGGGNEGLVTAMYLAKHGGMEVAIFEDNATSGLPNNTHTDVVGDLYHSIIPADLPDFELKGDLPAVHKVAHGSIFEEDQSCLAFYHSSIDPDQEKSAAELARFSQKDADTWLTMWKLWKEQLEPAFLKTIYNPVPKEIEELDALKGVLLESGVLDAFTQTQSSTEYLRDTFESEAVVAHFLRTVQTLGFNTPMEYARTGIFQLLGSFLLTRTGSVGSNAQAWYQSALAAFQASGGKIITDQKVDSVVIATGKAIGVRFAGGEVSARKLVVSNVSPETLCCKLAGEEHFDAQAVRRVKNLQSHGIQVIRNQWTVKQLPTYTAATINAEIGTCGALNLISKNPEVLLKETAYRRAGETPPVLSPMVWSNSNVESDKFIVASEQFTASGEDLSESIIAHWQKFAPNMTKDNIENSEDSSNGNWAVIDNIPSQMGAFRPVPELARHRTPVSNLYATGNAWPYFGCAMASQGYNCYKVISEDFDVAKPWEESGRPY